MPAPRQRDGRRIGAIGFAVSIGAHTLLLVVLYLTVLRVPTGTRPAGVAEPRAIGGIEVVQI
ncbi:MAG: hypothetical protein ACRELD_16395, partial [Longimicrobiales bacterium]